MRASMNTSIFLALSLISVAAAASGCSAASTDTAADPAKPAATQATPGAPAVPPKGEPDDPAPVDVTTDPNAKPCTGKPGELYALSATKLTEGSDVPLCRFDGSVLMIVNVASHCGYTPQYAPLQALYAKYRAKGFYVLGFPSKSFNQESASDADVSAFCTNEYKITFPMFTIANVNAPNEQPVYTWLKGQPGFDADIPWNFEKWIITRHGKVAQRIAYTTSPDEPEVVSAIEAELAKP
jgi:glutathione peroxidase